MPGSSGTNARVIAYNAVVQWLGPHVNLPPSQIKVDRKFAGKPPGGYGQTTGAYMTMCDDISRTLSAITGRKVVLSGGWRIKHQGDKIADFINAVAIVLMAAGMSATGRNALNWAIK
ncbi:MAG TPA: hypothetical protein VJK06_08460 [Methyloceanibacter sp.]|jgi:hypothetical protein|nr:hypothetical protein [Methyloceanibacter sp.]